GAVLLAASGISGAATPVTNAAFVDLFLTLFADGWFGLGLVAALVLTHFGARATATRGFGTAVWVLTASLALRSGARLATDAYGIAGLAAVESVAGVMAAAGWLYLTLSLLARPRTVLPTAGSQVTASLTTEPVVDPAGRALARAALWLLALKAVAEVISAVPAGEDLVGRLGLRVLLLHAFLLGAVTPGLIAAARTLLSPRGFAPVGALAATVVVLLACLVPLTGVWPVALAGRWSLWAAAVSSLLPAFVVAYAMVRLRDRS